MAVSEVYNEDCMIGMARYPDNYFELAIVDPPYGIGKRILGTWGKKTGMNNAVRWDNIVDKKYFNKLFRVSKNQILWGANYYINYLYPSMGVVCWDKMNGTNNLSDFEFAWTSFNEKTARIFRMHHFSEGYDKKIHPTQKPVALYKWLLRNYAKEGDKILDTHAGSCSSVIACIDSGFDWMAFEIDPDYYKAAIERINNHVKQGDLFNENKQDNIQTSLL